MVKERSQWGEPEARAFRRNSSGRRGRAALRPRQPPRRRSPSGKQAWAALWNPPQACLMLEPRGDDEEKRRVSKNTEKERGGELADMVSCVLESVVEDKDGVPAMSVVVAATARFATAAA
uniref:Uncharacterized protein n=1 Tax=Ananas comosus var. bracteatus TaxID=296719 RepID=A0A6V7QV74_ANACO